ncbi:MAG: glycosyltransferase [Bacteroidales bacterium]|nr:glycosyltransferase [Bacteroidales bacterium]
MPKKINVSVINELVSDQRVHRTCLTLQKAGFEVELIGRKYKTSPDLAPRSYACKRMHLLFKKGPLFYAEFNIRLFFLLLFKKSDALFSNDLDTLLPNYLVALLKRRVLIYDSHELFTEVPELKDRPLIKSIWTSLEAFILPKLKHVITVNQSIANILEKKYAIEVQVIRNIPLEFSQNKKLSKEDMGYDKNDFLILLQGAGINIDRGAEEALEAMKFVFGAKLLIIGSGDVFELLKKKRISCQLEEKVQIIDKLPYEELMKYTSIADLGLSLDKDTNLNYRYSLPNKVFDYIHAGVPLLVSRLPELVHLVEKYEIGACVRNINPQCIADRINAIKSNEQFLDEWKKNLVRAQKELSWELEEENYLNFLSKVRA